MPTKVTAAEAAELRTIKAEYDAIQARIFSRPAPQIGREIVDHMQQLFHMAPELADRSALLAAEFLTRSTPEEQRQLDKLTGRWNEVVNGAYRRNRAAKEAREAARERQAIRSAMCGSCFCIHRPGQTECD